MTCADVLASLVRTELALGKTKEAASFGRELIASAERAAADQTPTAQALANALTGKGDPEVAVTSLNRLRRAAAQKLLPAEDWMEPHLACIVVERMYSMGKPPEDANALESLLKNLESKKTCAAADYRRGSLASGTNPPGSSSLAAGVSRRRASVRELGRSNAGTNARYCAADCVPRGQKLGRRFCCRRHQRFGRLRPMPGTS